MENETQGPSVMSSVLSIIKKMDAVTVGEITELFNTDYADKDKPEARNEIAKIVSELKRVGSIQPIGYRKCSIAGRKVLEWTANMDAMPNQTILNRLFQEVESKRIKAANAAADHQEHLQIYQELYKKMVPEANLDDDVVEKLISMIKTEHGTCKVPSYCIIEIALEQDLDVLAIHTFSETTARSDEFKKLYDGLPQDHVTNAAIKQLEKLEAAVVCIQCKTCKASTWNPAEVGYVCKSGHSLAQFTCEIEANEGDTFRASIRDPEDKVIHSITTDAGKTAMTDGFIKYADDAAELELLLKAQNIIPQYAKLAATKRPAST
jgi:hypothetical protein